MHRLFTRPSSSEFLRSFLAQRICRARIFNGGLSASLEKRLSGCDIMQTDLKEANLIGALFHAQTLRLRFFRL